MCHFCGEITDVNDNNLCEVCQDKLEEELDHPLDLEPDVKKGMPHGGPIQ